MTITIVNGFEVVEIDVEGDEPVTAPFRVGDILSQAIHQQRAIWQAGQRVGVGKVIKTLVEKERERLLK